MKKFKKVFAVLLTLAMVMGLCMTTAAADNVIGNSDDTGIISVGGIDDENVIVKAYPIITATYDSNGNFSGYSNPYNISNMEAPTEAELAAIATNLPSTSYTLNGPDASGNYTNAKVGENPEVSLGIGMYLIIVEGAETSVYNPAVASINYVNKNGENAIEPGDLDMISSTNTWVKKSGQPGVDKTVRDTEFNADGEVTNGTEKGKNEITGSQGNTANIGDQVTYDVTISPIPNYGGNYPVLNIKDTLSAGLTYVEGSINVFIVDENGMVIDTLTGAPQAGENVDYIYTASETSKEITVNFVVDGKYTLNDFAGKKALIEYRATVNDSAAVNSNGNKNDVTLEYSRNSNISGDTDEEEKETHTYTFDIDGTAFGIDGETTTQNIINKLGDVTDTVEVEGEKVRTALEGAKFGLFTDAEATKPYTNGDDKETTWNNIVTDGKGQTYIKGLKAGTYYLKELEAPEGYSVNTHIFTIVINATIDKTTGLLTKWSVTIDNQPAASFTINNEGKTVVKELLPKTEETGNHEGFNILNTKLSSLPSTGGIGTTIFTIGGCAIMIIAAALFFASRRKSTK